MVLLNLLEYAYVLRVPIAILGTMLFVSLGPFGGPGEGILRGILDIAYTDQNDLLAGVQFAILSAAAFMTAAAAGITARIIVVDGRPRFSLAPLPAPPSGWEISPGIELLFRLLPMLCGWAVIVAALWQTNAKWAAGIAGSAAGFALVYGGLGPILRWFRRIAKDLKFPASVIEAIPGDKTGYTYLPPHPRAGQITDSQRFAVTQLFVSLAFYAVIGLFKAFSSFGERPIPFVPTLAMAMSLLLLLCWIFAGLTFFFDRYRVPALLATAAYVWCAGWLPQADDFYHAPFDESAARRANSRRIRPRDIVTVRTDGAHGGPGEPLVVVAAEGGGIRAAAWTARVLTGLHLNTLDLAHPFHTHLRFVSAVSGGSTGAMYYLAFYRNGRLRESQRTLDRHPVVTAGQASTLDEVVWGLVYPDTIFTFAPFFKGLGPHPRTGGPSFFDGSWVLSGRGGALEEAWEQQLKRELQIAPPALSAWRDEAKRGERPAVIMNSTVVETGERYLLGTTDLDEEREPDGSLSERARRQFSVTYPERDIRVATAARLSATFPYVSPAARMFTGHVFSNGFHAVDGAYFDNYGMATLVEWLHQALATATPAGRPSRVLIIEIRSAPVPQLARAKEAERSRPTDHGALFQATAPIRTELGVRSPRRLPTTRASGTWWSGIGRKPRAFPSVTRCSHSIMWTTRTAARRKRSTGILPPRISASSLTVGRASATKSAAYGGFLQRLEAASETRLCAPRRRGLRIAHVGGRGFEPVVRTNHSGAYGGQPFRRHGAGRPNATCFFP
jgi:hypothetical protein